MTIELDDLPGDPTKAAIVAATKGLEAASIEGERAVAESQAGFVVAKRFPRSPKVSIQRIVLNCQRVSLAEQAEYSFARGGSDISGPTIRLAEVLAQAWGNIQFGLRELATIEGASMMMAYCNDLETNTRSEKIFVVKHERKARGQTTKLTDSRDVYEMTANLGARRLRSCILQIIPGDVVELAVEACRATLEEAEKDPGPERIAKMLELFAGYNVTKAMIEEKMQRNVEAFKGPQMVALRKIYNSLKDGMSRPEDWFDRTTSTTESAKAKLEEVAAAATERAAQQEEKPKKKRKRRKKTQEPAQEPQKTAQAAPGIAPEPEQAPNDAPTQPAEKTPEEAFNELSAAAAAVGAAIDEATRPDEPQVPDYRTSTVEVGPKPSQWAAQVEGLRKRALDAGVSMDEWHGAVIHILGKLGYDDINAVPNTNRPPLKRALTVLVETVEDEADARAREGSDA